MKICAILLLISCTITVVLSEYPRLKRRGPVGPQRPPSGPPPRQFMKKWQQHQQRPPVRSRPIPVHMPNSHKIPMGMPASNNRPISHPVRTFWKNTQTTFRTPVEKPYLPSTPSVIPEKMFLSAPSIIVPEYDFHIQTNNIPTHANPIKQVGEKGPIHTIPAPNLSLADKPHVINEMKHEIYHPQVPQQQATYVQVQKAHQYQVTEAPEYPKHKVFRNQQQNLPQNYEIQSTPYQTPQSSNEQLNANYEVVNVYPHQQEMLETYAVPVVHQQPQLQPQYLQALLAQQSQLFQPEQEYVQHIQPGQVASDKVGDQPEYHTFNYEEPHPDQNPKGMTQKEISSLVTAVYNLEPNAEASEPVPAIARNPLGSQAQSQYVQNYFDTRNDNGGNNVEPDAKHSEVVTNAAAEDDTESEGFYSSLPNKEAADVLASLQAAGKINSNLMHSSKKNPDQNPMSIIVPDQENSQEFSSNDNEENQEYEDDYSQEDAATENQQQNDESFGHRIKTRE